MRLATIRVFLSICDKQRNSKLPLIINRPPVSPHHMHGVVHQLVGLLVRPLVALLFNAYLGSGPEGDDVP